MMHVRNAFSFDVKWNLHQWRNATDSDRKIECTVCALLEEVLERLQRAPASCAACHNGFCERRSLGDQVSTPLSRTKDNRNLCGDERTCASYSAGKIGASLWGGAREFSPYLRGLSVDLQQLLSIYELPRPRSRLRRRPSRRDISRVLQNLRAFTPLQTQQFSNNLANYA